MAKSKPILKRILRALAITVAIPLALVILLVAVPFAGSIGIKQEPLPIHTEADAQWRVKALRRASIGERWMLGLARICDSLTPMPKSMPADFDSGHFYPGGKSVGETWRLGYAQAIITPGDFESKAYRGGGNIPVLTLKNKLDDLKVRVIALSAGEEVNIFAAVDTVGLTNKQVRQIRALVSDLNLQSVNIAATHVHSAVDTLGFYSKGGADEEFLAFVNEKTAGAIREAVAALEPGSLYLSQMGNNDINYWDLYDECYDAIGFPCDDDGTYDWSQWNDEWGEKFGLAWEDILREYPVGDYGLGGFTYNRRQDTCSSMMTKLRFAPDDPDSRETVLLNFAAHPCWIGMRTKFWPADAISGDFPYYMEEAINAAGANMIYFNSAVNGIYFNYGGAETLVERVQLAGRDFAGIALAMTMPPEKLVRSGLIDPEGGHNWEYDNIMFLLREQGPIPETELIPQLDIYARELQIEIENPILRWAAKLLKSNYSILRDGKKLKLATEIGRVELGGAVTVALLPGEFTPGLVWGGGDTLAENALRMRDFEAKTLSESAGRELLVFGLCNDELGYIVPGNDYIQFYFPLEGLIGRWTGLGWWYHYQELLSPGPNAAAAMSEAFAQLFTDAPQPTPAP